jgi:predicted Zn-dependent protease
MRDLRATFALVALLSGCGSLPLQPAAPESVPAPEPAARTESVAIASLMDGARVDADAGRLSQAAASLERALRIEPRNPRVWQELARVRLAQGDYMQVEGLAARSNTWARDDPALRAENWRLIARAREARGDQQGAMVAREAAARQR